MTQLTYIAITKVKINFELNKNFHSKKTTICHLRKIIGVR